MTSLYKYQKQGILAIERLDGRALLADDMGLAKPFRLYTTYAETKQPQPPP